MLIAKVKKAEGYSTNSQDTVGLIDGDSRWNYVRSLQKSTRCTLHMLRDRRAVHCFWFWEPRGVLRHSAMLVHRCFRQT